MVPQVYGIEHILYMIITSAVGAAGLLFIHRNAKSEKAKILSLKGIALLLLISIVTNRLSQVFRYDDIRWYCIIPDSFCGMTSLVLALSVLLGKKDNPIYHFIWLLGIFGGISTVVYPTFVSQDSSFFYLPTISGLLHHSFCAVMVIALFMLKQIDLTYKKWYCVILGFTYYLTVGAFLMSVFGMSDAFHIAEPLLPDTPLTVWFMAPIYITAHGAIFAVVELIKRRRGPKAS